MTTDFTLLNAGSADENLPSDRMYFNGSIVIEPRYVPAILDGLTADGLTLRRWESY